ncbi:hypothetical protein CQW23_06084 [Capsicum baccatum]|uniref:N-acetyltransferase domain-containing protein n=1 Tax=Capsicum baccatum TaxID=33114 RepID=A0A2G2X2A4_CAPBA|nr:hypothetical protein CQW23_06084 [Capsicum baccatum]
MNNADPEYRNGKLLISSNSSSSGLTVQNGRAVAGTPSKWRKMLNPRFLLHFSDSPVDDIGLKPETISDAPVKALPSLLYLCQLPLYLCWLMFFNHNLSLFSLFELVKALPSFVIVEREGHIIACATLFPYFEEKYREVAALVVSPHCRGQGQGDKLLDYLCNPYSHVYVTDNNGKLGIGDQSGISTQDKGLSWEVSLNLMEERKGQIMKMMLLYPLATLRRNNMIYFALKHAIGLKCAVEFEVAYCTMNTYHDCTFDVIYYRDTILHIQITVVSSFPDFHTNKSVYCEELCQHQIQMMLEEAISCPGKVLLPICVLNIKPSNIIGDIMPIKFRIYIINIFLVSIIPSTLMVKNGDSEKLHREREHLRYRGGKRKLSCKLKPKLLKRLKDVQKWKLQLRLRGGESAIEKQQDRHYSRSFVEGLSPITSPMSRLTQNKVKFQWSDFCDKSFKELKTRITTALVLALPDGIKGFVVYFDASRVGLGYVLMQRGSWDEHLSLIEFAYNKSYHSSIQMASFEALYGRRYRSPIDWFELGEAALIGPNAVFEAMEKVKLIRERLKIAQSCQKSYADWPSAILAHRGEGQFTIHQFSEVQRDNDASHHMPKWHSKGAPRWLRIAESAHFPFVNFQSMCLVSGARVIFEHLIYISAVDCLSQLEACPSDSLDSVSRGLSDY